MHSPQSEAFETTAIQSMFSLISKTVAKKFDFALELVSSGLLTDTQMDGLGVDSLGREGSEQEQMVQNYKILREVKNTVSKEPERFDDLCEVLEKLEYTECSKRLRGTISMPHTSQRGGVFTGSYHLCTYVIIRHRITYVLPSESTHLWV